MSNSMGAWHKAGDPASTGNHVLYGGHGNETIIGANGNSTIIGSNGDVTFENANGDLNIHGGNHNERISGGYGNTTIIGGSGNDSLDMNSANTVVYGGHGHNSITDYSGGGHHNVIYAGSGSDVIRIVHSGASTFDTIYGGSGNDTIWGLGTLNATSGGRSHDVFYGGSGNDSVFAGVGPAKYYGGGGTNTIDFGAQSGSAYFDNRDGSVAYFADTGVTGGAVAGSVITGFQRVSSSIDLFDTLEAATGVWVDGHSSGSIVMESVAAHGVETIEGAGTLMGRLGVSGATYFGPILNTIAGQAQATITGFDRSAGDKLLFTSADSYFSNMTNTPASFTVVNAATGHVATAGGAQFIYEQDTHQLWYDADGTGSGAAVLVATLDPAKSNFGTALTASDFVLHH